MSNLAANNSKKILGEGLLSDAATNVVKTANSVLNNSAPKNSMFGAMNDATKNVVKTANSVLNNSAPKNSMFGAMNDKMNNVGKNIQSGFNTFSNTVSNTAKTIGKNFVPLANNSQASSSLLSSEWAWPAGIFLVLVIIFVFLLNYFMNEIKSGYHNLSSSLRTFFKMDAAPPTPLTVTIAPPTTQDMPTTTPTHSQLKSQSILESVLPLNGPPEVFNVSKNEFSYYDAEPLCKALGAELATYEQIKDAYGKGADWCNYGWVKGQVAVYPTQKATWDELQSGSEDERDACGKPGINGGYFDNPEMKFGVNCYGPKPGQSAHDEAELMKQGRIPSSVSSLKTEEKVKQFEAQANNLGITPFNKNKWMST